MDKEVIRLFEASINQNLSGIIISNSTDKERMLKVKIRPVLMKNELNYQASEYIGEKVMHVNLTRQELINKLPEWLEGLFRQVEISTGSGKATILISKKGKATIINKTAKTPGAAAAVSDGDNAGVREERLLHNKKKNYILQEGIVLPFLVDLGVMTGEGKIVNARMDKFRQINRFLEFIEDVLPYLDNDRELTILDFGCGKSYLTFAMYYYLKIVKGYQINVIGLDLKKDVITRCNRLSEQYGYDKLHFLVGDIASYTGRSTVDMVVTLHACDTATDHALSKAVSWGAKVILSVPCCQHELNKQIKSDILKPILKYGIIKERLAALVTDALRGSLLEAEGYRVQLLEFIDMEHTPKNILIRAVKRSSAQEDEETGSELRDCMSFLGVSPCLHGLLTKGARQDDTRQDN